MNTRLSCLYFMLLYCANVYLHMDSLFLFLCRVNVFLHQKLLIIVSTAYSRFDTALDPFKIGCYPSRLINGTPWCARLILWSFQQYRRGHEGCMYGCPFPAQFLILFYRFVVSQGIPPVAGCNVSKECSNSYWRVVMTSQLDSITPRKDSLGLHVR